MTPWPVSTMSGNTTTFHQKKLHKRKGHLPTTITTITKSTTAVLGRDFPKLGQFNSKVRPELSFQGTSKTKKMF